MGKFYLWLKQAGGGCDYMIGCGEKLIPLNSREIEDARIEALIHVEHGGFFTEEREAEHAVLYEFKENMTHIISAEKKKRLEEKLSDVTEARIKKLEEEIKALKKARRA